MPDRDTSLARTCLNCGSMGSTRLGSCSVCGLSVCDRCGNVQHVGGEKRATHNKCLSKDQGFSMIKFVK